MVKTAEYKGYTITNTGEVFGRRGKKSSLGKHKDGYLQVTFYNTKKLVHRLIAELFIPNPLGLPEVNHKDGDKSNNNDWNLEWCTHNENIQHALVTGLCDNRGEKSGRVKLTESQVLEIRKHKGMYKEIASLYGVSSVQIGLIIRRKTWVWL